ncbi:MAG TPA: DUF3570 domain-containing protein [Polyangiaceae bacterium]
MGLSLLATSAAAESPAPAPVVERAALQATTYSDSDHVIVFTPVASGEIDDRQERWNVRGQYLVDTISAASVDIVSTASSHWRETRQAGTLEGSYKPRSVGAKVSGAFSSEPDYLSFAGGALLTWDFADKNETLLLGYSLDHDTIGRAHTPFSVFSHRLWQHDLNVGVTITLSRTAILSLLGDVMVERGDQSKPYRYIPMFDALVARGIERGEAIDSVNAKRLPERPLEQLPLSRERYALTARFGYRLAHATLRADERVYADSWRLFASTSDLRLYLDVSKRTTLGPHFRVHAQNSVYFWRRAYVSNFEANNAWQLPRYRTGDRELGPLVTVGTGFGARVGIGPEREPSAFTLVMQGDLAASDFLDDLYLTSRLAGFVTVGIEGAFE